jgi:sn-glycerol 3-phosphate transport system ATP-binding protein
MDEPLSNLDAQLRQEMRHELRELQRRLGLTVVYVTHDQAEAMSMADQVVLLNRGRVEQAGAPRELYARPATAFAARFIGTPPMNLVALRGDRIDGSDVAAGLSAATLGVRPESITLRDDDGVPAVVQGVEYLGADLVLRCGVGTQTLLVRAPGRQQAQAGDAVRLHWQAHDAHGFDDAGRRVH